MRTPVVLASTLARGEQPMSRNAESATIADRWKERNETLDRELEQSFPASDPPSSIQPGTRSGAPDRDKKEEPSEGRPVPR